MHMLHMYMYSHTCICTCVKLDSRDVTEICMYTCVCLQDVRRKAARIVASKCTLAARVDSFHEDIDISIGESEDK